MLAEGEDLDPKFVAIVRDAGAVAGQIMSRPIITVGPDTEVSKIARLLGEYRIKRVPVVHDGHLMGIVSRADLLRDFVGAPVTTSPNQSLLGRAIAISMSTSITATTTGG